MSEKLGLFLVAFQFFDVFDEGFLVDLAYR
jgi:hypothetical protein